MKVLPPSEREDLIEDVRQFEQYDGGCFCSTTSNPPCSWCEHPGNLGDDAPEEIYNTMNAIDKLQDTKFLPSDRVYVEDDVKDLVKGYNLTRFEKSKRVKIVDQVCVDQNGIENVVLEGWNRQISSDEVFHVEDVQKEVTTRLLNHILKMQSFNYGK